MALRSESFPVSQKIPIQDVPEITQCVEGEEKILGKQPYPQDIPERSLKLDF